MTQSKKREELEIGSVWRNKLDVAVSCAIVKVAPSEVVGMLGDQVHFIQHGGPFDGDEFESTPKAFTQHWTPSP